jgi:hypothetical protein
MSNPPLKPSVPCDAAKDGQFGPGINCSAFDFTLTFEQAIFGIGITSFYLILFIIRLGQLYGQSIKVRPGLILWVKLVRDVEIEFGINLTRARQCLSQYREFQ